MEALDYFQHQKPLEGIVNTKNDGMYHPNNHHQQFL